MHAEAHGLPIAVDGRVLDAQYVQGRLPGERRCAAP
jgi:hypothetical protein